MFTLVLSGNLNLKVILQTALLLLIIVALYLSQALLRKQLAVQL
jgi:hypothetical protein